MNAVSNILIVDDNPDDSFLLSYQIKKILDANIAVAETVKEAVTLINPAETPQTGYDYLFCDLCLPERDGVELLDILTKQNYQGKVVLVSGSEAAILESVAFLAKEKGLNIVDSCQKPLEGQQLKSLLANI